MVVMERLTKVNCSHNSQLEKNWIPPMIEMLGLVDAEELSNAINEWCIVLI
jgi:hypothetical protein